MFFKNCCYFGTLQIYKNVFAGPIEICIQSNVACTRIALCFACCEIGVIFEHRRHCIRITCLVSFSVIYHLFASQENLAITMKNLTANEVRAAFIEFFQKNVIRCHFLYFLINCFWGTQIRAFVVGDSPWRPDTSLRQCGNEPSITSFLMSIKESFPVQARFPWCCWPIFWLGQAQESR